MVIQKESKKEINVLEEKISKLGGGYASKRAELKEKKIQLKAKLEQIEEEIHLKKKLQKSFGLVQLL